MIILQIASNSGYKPRPDFQIRVYDDGTVRYEGHYYVAVVGVRLATIGIQELQRVRDLADLLIQRNKKNYLKKGVKPAYKVKMVTAWKIEFDVDEKDVISDDIITQIIDICGVKHWINSSLDLFLVLSKPRIRTRELSLVRAADSSQATKMFLEARRNMNYRSEWDYIAFCIGRQKPDTIENPVIYCIYTDYRIKERTPELLLNQGPPLPAGPQEVFLFVSFGKRYNDPAASYFLVLAKNLSHAASLFNKTYPHFMPGDFQLVDPGIIYQPIPIFDTHIPVAIR